MANTTLTIRIDEETKQEFDRFCKNIGMSMSTAFLIFAKKAIATQRFPFELTANTTNAENSIEGECYDKL